MMGIEAPNIVVVGSLNMDIMVEAPLIPEKGETVLGRNVRILPGGKGANQAVAASRLGAHTTLIGAVGNDMYGKQFIEELHRNHIVDAIKIMPEENTGIASIWLHDHDNRIIVAPGANSKISWEDVERKKAVIDHADVLLTQLEIPLDTVIKTIRYANHSGKKVILNPAPAQPLPDDIYPMLTCLTPNRNELSILSETPEVQDAANKDALYEAMAKMIGKGLSSLIVTLGSEGAIYMNDAGHTFYVPGRKIKVLDTTGAGDCFNAAFTVSLAKGWSMERAAKFAVAASALAVTKFGAQNGMPESCEVNRILETSFID
jgi:ribokinase